MHNVFTLAVVAFYVALWTTIFVFFIYRHKLFDLKIVHLLLFCTDVHKSQAAIFIFYIYSDSSAEERKDQIYQQQPKIKKPQMKLGKRVLKTMRMKIL